MLYWVNSLKILDKYSLGIQATVVITFFPENDHVLFVDYGSETNPISIVH